MISLFLAATLAAAQARIAHAPARPTAARVDTRAWLGAAYAPAAAPGDLWLSPALFARYLPAVDRELAAAARHLATSTVRVFLHTLAYEAGPAAFLDNVDTFLAVAEGRGIRAGLVLFDACWNTAGGNATSAGECVPVKGRHNGCWYESPQAADMTTLERYKPYVDGVVSRFGDDSRVAWIEVYNEPRAPNADFVFALRDAGYEWATALQPSAPLISCWDDNNNTEIVDHHDYGANFASEWAPAVYVNPRKGAVITEAGSRWYQPPFPGDQGSTLLVVNFLEALAARVANGSAPYVPGAMISWELMVGNSHTRWHWNSPDGAAEPAIPWCGNLFPDGSPVSYTEAAALRRYATGVSDFLAYDKFLESSPSLVDGDAYLLLPAGATHAVAVDGGALLDGIFEAALWLDEGGAASLIVRAGALPSADAAPRARRVRAPPADAAAPTKRRGAAPAPAPAPAPPSCAFGARLSDSDACSGGPPGYRDLSVARAADPLGACAAACCAWDACTAWVVRDLVGRDGNCSDEKCCWLKPDCAPDQRTHVAGATAQFRAAAPGPPLPAAADGYHVALDTATESLTVSRCASGTCARLGAFNTSLLETGIVRGAWNMLRVVLETDAASGALSLRVFFNPTVPETGYTGVPAVDAALVPRPLPPRLALVDAAPLPAGALALAAGIVDARVDYAVVVDAAAAAPAAAAPKRVRRLGGPKILLAYEVTPVVDARGARLRFAATLSEFSPIEVLNIARAGARAAGGAARAAPRTHTHSKASHRDLHAIDFENSTHPTLVTRDGCIIVSLRQLRAVVTGARALVLFADGADGDIKHFLDMLHADDAAAVFAAPAAPGAHEAHSSGALLLGGEVGAGAGTPSDAPGGGVSIMAAATESGAAAPPDSFEYAVLAALLRCVAEASDAELTALSRRVKGIKTGTRQGQTPTTEEMFNNVGALKEELEEFMSSLEGHVAAVDSVLEADEDLEALVLSVPRHRADAGAGGANDAEQSLEFREEVVEAEELLELFSASVASTISKSRVLIKKVAVERERITHSLSVSRNNILRVQIYIMIVSMGLTACSTIAGFFGMNLGNGFCGPEGCASFGTKDNGSSGFNVVVISSVVLSLFFVILLSLYAERVIGFSAA